MFLCPSNRWPLQLMVQSEYFPVRKMSFTASGMCEFDDSVSCFFIFFNWECTRPRERKLKALRLVKRRNG